MRKIAFLIGLSCMLFAQFLDAQITTEEAPPIFDLYMPSLKGGELEYLRTISSLSRYEDYRDGG